MGAFPPVRRPHPCRRPVAVTPTTEAHAYIQAVGKAFKDTAADVRAITWENASRLYRHPVPEAVQTDPDAY